MAPVAKRNRPRLQVRPVFPFVKPDSSLERPAGRGGPRIALTPFALSRARDRPRPHVVPDPGEVRQEPLGGGVG